MNSILKTFTKSQLIDIIHDGMSSEIAKHETARQRTAKLNDVKAKVASIKTLRLRNPFFCKK